MAAKPLSTPTAPAAGRCIARSMTTKQSMSGRTTMSTGAVPRAPRAPTGTLARAFDTVLGRANENR